MSMVLDQNNINNMVYVLDSESKKVTKISDQNYTFGVKANETMLVFSFFDMTKYIVLYLEYTITDVDNSENIDSSGGGNDSMITPIIIVVIVISIALVVVLLVLSIIFLCR